MATIQKRKNKNGTPSYRVMIRTQDGLPATSKTFPTHQEAKDWAIQQEALRRQGLFFPEQIKKKHTLADLISRYIEEILSLKLKNTRDSIRQLNWWKEKIGSTPLNLLTPDLIAKYRKELLDGLTPNGTKRTPATTNRYLAALSVVCSYGVKECCWLTTNPVIRVTKCKEAHGRDRVLTSDECSRLLEACSKSPSKLLLPFVLLALTTGARRGELIGLTWDAVDLERGIIHLKHTKNGRPRALAIVGRALDLLRDLLGTRNPENPMVFPSKARFGQLTLRKPWEKALKDAKIAHFRLHDLRHCFATFASETGASNIELAAATGHLSLSQLQRYCHPNAEVVRRLSHAVSEKLTIGMKDDSVSQSS